MRCATKPRHPSRGPGGVARWLPGLLLVLLLSAVPAACGGDDAPAGGGSLEDDGTTSGVPTVLLAADDTGAIHEIDPATGEATLLVETGLGPITAMAFDPAEEVLYAAMANTDGGDTGQCPGYACTYTVDRESGTPTLFHGNYGVDLEAQGYYPSEYLRDMAIHPVSGTLYAYWYGECSSLFSIDKATGTGTHIGRWNPPCMADTLAIDGSGAAYATDYTTLVRMDLTGATAPTDLGSLAFSGFEFVPDVRSLAPHPDDGTLLALTYEWSTSTTELARLDVCTMTVTRIGTPAGTLDGLVLVTDDPLPQPPPCE